MNTKYRRNYEHCNTMQGNSLIIVSSKTSSIFFQNRQIYFVTFRSFSNAPYTPKTDKSKHVIGCVILIFLGRKLFFINQYYKSCKCNRTKMKNKIQYKKKRNDKVHRLKV